MQAALRRELRLRASEYVLGVANELDLIELANRILVGGTYTPSLGELAYLRDVGMVSVGPPFEAALQELDEEPPNRLIAAETLVRELALQIIIDPSRSMELLVRIPYLEDESDRDRLGVTDLRDVYSGFDLEEYVFDETGRRIEDAAQRQRMLEASVVVAAQAWLARHPEKVIE